jgi:hypothetical protein
MHHPLAANPNLSPVIQAGAIRFSIHQRHVQVQQKKESSFSEEKEAKRLLFLRIGR